MNKKDRITERFLLWMCGWANLFDALILIFTFGFYSSQKSLGLRVAFHLAQWRYKARGYKNE